MPSKKELEDMLGVKPKSIPDIGDSYPSEWESYENFGVEPHPKFNFFEVDEWEEEQGRRLSKHPGEDDAYMADTFAACFRQYPEQENSCVNKEFEKFMQTTLESSEFKKMHQSTAANMLTSDMAAVQLAEGFYKLTEETKKNKEQKKNGKLTEAQKKRKDEAALYRAVGKAVSQAQEEVEELESVQRAIGMDAGSSCSMNSEEIVKLFTKVKNSAQLRRIMQLAGRYRLSAQSKQQSKVKHGYDDMIGIQLAGDIGQMVPVELARLADEDLELDVMRRLVDKNVFSREYQGLEPQKQGPIVVCVDESGSTRGEIVANEKAFSLAMYWIARHQKRDIYLIGYSAGCNFTLFASPRDDFDDLLVWLSHFYCGGTTMDVACMSVPRNWPVWKKEWKGQADMIILTDAAVHIEQTMVDSFNKWRKENDVKVQTIVIGANGDSMKPISDSVHCVNQIMVDDPSTQQAFSI